MKKLLLITLLLWTAVAEAQFAPGQILTAAELNAAFASTAPAPGVTCLGASSALNYTSNTFSCNAAINAITLGGATFSAPGPIGSVSTSSGAFSSVSTPSATIGGGTINATSVGASSASTGAFTTLSASSTVSGAGFTSLLSPYLLSATAASTYAPLASPVFTGVPAAPTAATGTSTTQLATTAFISASPKITTPNVVGEATGTASPAGSWGETATASGSAVSLTTGVVANCATMPLTAGKWLIYGSMSFNPAGSTVMSGASAGVSTTSGAVPAVPLYSSWSGTAPAGGVEIFTVPIQIVNPTTTISYFLVGAANFTVSTATMTCQVSAVRIP